jgi:hypothetical protein
MTDDKPKKKGVNIIFSTPISGDGKRIRGVLDHEDGRWSIATANPDGSGAVIEHTYTLGQVQDWAIKAFAGDPEVRQTKGLGAILAASALTMMVGIGMIQMVEKS